VRIISFAVHKMAGVIGAQPKKGVKKRETQPKKNTKKKEAASSSAVLCAADDDVSIQDVAPLTHHQGLKRKAPCVCDDMGDRRCKKSSGNREVNCP
jgi:hypothetical protein